MKEQIKTVKMYESDRNWLEKLKRRLRKKSFQDTFRAIRKTFTKHKLDYDIE